MGGAAPDTEGGTATKDRDTPDTHAGTPSATLTPTDPGTHTLTFESPPTLTDGRKEGGEDSEEEDTVERELDLAAFLAAAARL